MKKQLESRLKAVEASLPKPSRVVILAPGEPIPAGAEIVIIDDIGRKP